MTGPAVPSPTVPSATYRLQFSKDTTFTDAVELLPYLDALGVGGLYASPLLESGAGSNHGYDVVDPTKVSQERGGEEGRRALVAAVRERGLQFVLDIVPNHLGVEVAKANPWWWDVLTHGRASRYAGHFDIDWDAGPVLLPILDADEEKALSELSLADDRSELRYYEHAFPVAPGTGDTGSPQEVHERQHYRLMSWKRGAAELTYRRFFDVSTLAAVRVEIPEIFEDTHREILRWVHAGEIDGIRVDHPDGLSDPGGYVRRLRAAIGPRRWLLAEKILGVGEELPPSWPVNGTSGYEALREIQGVLVDPSGAGLLTQFAAEHVGRKESLHAAEHTARREVADTILAAEVRRIAETCLSEPSISTALVPVPETAPSTEEEPGEAADRVRNAVAELLCGFPVYRSYLPEGRSALEIAVSVARTHRPDLADVLSSIRAAMLAEPHGLLATRVQQTSGMVMAKGVEDTAYYRWNRFVALNEVGGDPSRFGVSPSEFHSAMAAREASWPATMTTLSTHDTKHSEDVRARLAVIAEIPGEWIERTRRWAAAHPLPDPSFELLAWQNPRRRLADLRRAVRGLSHQGLEGGQAHHQPRRRGRGGGRGDRGLAGAGAGGRGRGGRDRGVRRADLHARLVELAGPEAAADRRAGRARRLSGHRAVRVLPGRPRQPAPGRLGAAPGAPRPSGRGPAARRRRVGGGEIAGHGQRAAAAPLPAGGVHRVPAAARRGSGRAPRNRVRPLRVAGGGGHAATGGARGARRLGGHRPPAPGGRHRLARRDHGSRRRRLRAVAGAGAGAVPGGVARAAGVAVR